MEYQPEQTEIIEGVQVDSMIWSEQETPREQGDMPSFQIYTVSKSIKNPQILEHIKPDYGSLGEFMKNVAISKDILLHNRKKKNEQQEDIQQKKLRTNLKNKNLDRVLKQQNSSPFQKTIASKMIVENLFEDSFGMNLNHFCSQNLKAQNYKHNYSSVGQLSQTLNEMIIKKKDSQVQFEVKNDVPTLARKRQVLSSKEISGLTFNERIGKIKKYQQNYISLRKVDLGFIEPPESVKRVPNGVVQFQNCSLSIVNLVNQIAVYELEQIKTLKLLKVSLSDDLFSLILDYFTHDAVSGLRELVIEKCSFSNMEKISERLKIFVEESSIMKIQLNSCNVSSRNFCTISLGIGCRNNFEYIALRNNNIGQVAKKCLDVLLKFHKELHLNLSGNPIQKELKGKSIYSRCF